MKKEQTIPITIRFPVNTHARIAAESDKTGISFNQLVVLACNGHPLTSFIDEAVKEAFEKYAADFARELRKEVTS